MAWTAWPCGCTVIVSFVFLVLTYLAGNVKTAAYLQIPHVEGGGGTDRFLRGDDGGGRGFPVV